MRSLFAAAMLLAVSSAVKIRQPDDAVDAVVSNTSSLGQIDSLSAICKLPKAEKEKRAQAMFTKADIDLNGNIEVKEFVDFIGDLEHIPEDFREYMEEHASTYMEMNDLESNGLAKEGEFTINEFQHALDCHLGFPRVWYEIMYLQHSKEIGADSADTYISLQSAAKYFGPKLEGVDEQALVGEFAKQSDDDKLSFVELWLALEKLDPSKKKDFDFVRPM